MKRLRENMITGKMKKMLCAAAVCLLLLTGAAAYAATSSSGQEDEAYAYKEETVQRGNVVRGVTENGSIDLEQSTVSFDVDVNEDEDEDEDTEEEEEEETSKYLQIEEVYVVNGQRIGEGEPLFRITQESIRSVRRKLESSLTQNELELADAKAEYSVSAIGAKNTYELSRVTAEQASGKLTADQTELYEEINGLQVQISVLEQEINSCLENLTDEDFKESLEEAKQSWESAKKLYEETGNESPAAYSANYQDYMSAKEQYESLLSQKEEWEETIASNQETLLSNNETILKKQAAFEAKQQDAQNTYSLNVSEGELAADVYALTKESLQDGIDTAQRAVNEAKQKLDGLNDFVGDEGVVYADESGMVTEIYYESGDKIRQTGALLTYVKTDAYTLSADVSEEDIAGVSIGDKVHVEFDAYPGEAYTGTVVSVTTTKTSDYAKTVSYPVQIRVEGDTGRLYGGMTAQITFVSEEAEDVLYVSRKAIVEQDQKTYVYIGSGVQKELKEVETGMENSTRVEIVSGLSEGDTVYIRSSAG